MSKRKLLIIDRDGTIIKEPASDFQVDSFEKLEFVPYAISSLARLRELDFEMIMATNQDGMGTEAFPEETFWGAHEKMITTLMGEGVIFDDVLIDRSMPEDNAPTRKPRTGMFGKYLSDDYDMEGSFVIGDRLTDVELAYNLGCKAILLADAATAAALKTTPYAATCLLVTQSWRKVAEFVRAGERTARVERNTTETQICVEVDIDGRGESRISTGLGFFDHMLSQIVNHAGITLRIDVQGDLHVDEHHTIEDTAIALGTALNMALGDKRGIARYGFALPMDECRAFVLLDLGGRIDFSWKVDFRREYIGDVPTEMFRHFFKSLAEAMHCNLHIEAVGENQHHLIEGVFKAFARTLRAAIKRDTFNYSLPSSKGVL